MSIGEIRNILIFVIAASVVLNIAFLVSIFEIAAEISELSKKFREHCGEREKDL